MRSLLPEPAPEPKQPLSDRQRDVLIGIARGNTRKDIAAEMDISMGRVDAICLKLCKRYGVRGKSGLIKLGMQLGLGAA